MSPASALSTVSPPRMNIQMQGGLHLTADLSGCAPAHPWMTQAASLRQACLDHVEQAGLQAVGDCFHQFPAQGQGQLGGVTGMVLLAESHLAVHTWPESGHVTLDVFVCNVGQDNSAAAQALMDRLVAGFEAGACHAQAVRRGAALTAST